MKTAFLLAAAFFPFAFATNHFGGIAVANSESGTSTYTCRTQAQVRQSNLFAHHWSSDLFFLWLLQWNQVASDAQGQGFKAIRIIGFDCNALDMASSAASAVGIQVLAGIYVAVRIFELPCESQFLLISPKLQGTIAAGLTGIKFVTNLYYPQCRKLTSCAATMFRLSVPLTPNMVLDASLGWQLEMR